MSEQNIFGRISNKDLLEYYYFEEERNAKLAEILERIKKVHHGKVTDYVTKFVPEEKIDDNKMYIVSYEKLYKGENGNITHEYPQLVLVYSHTDLMKHLIRSLTERKQLVDVLQTEFYIESGGVIIDKYEVIRIFKSDKNKLELPKYFADRSDYPRACKVDLDSGSESESESESGSEPESD